MECSLGIKNLITEGKIFVRLNPYSNGMLTWMKWKLF